MKNVIALMLGLTLCMSGCHSSKFGLGGQGGAGGQGKPSGQRGNDGRGGLTIKRAGGQSRTARPDR